MRKRYKLIFITIILAGLSVLCGCRNPEPKLPGGYKWYHDKELGFSIACPRHWTRPPVIEITPTYSCVSFYDIDDTGFFKDGSFVITNVLSVYKKPLNNIRFDEFIKKETPDFLKTMYAGIGIEEIGKDISEIPKIEREFRPIKISGIDAKIISDEMGWVYVFVPYKKHVYVLESHYNFRKMPLGSSANRTRYEEITDTMIKSFRITEK